MNLGKKILDIENLLYTKRKTFVGGICLVVGIMLGATGGSAINNATQYRKEINQLACIAQTQEDYYTLAITEIEGRDNNKTIRNGIVLSSMAVAFGLTGIGLGIYDKKKREK